MLRIVTASVLTLLIGISLGCGPSGVKPPPTAPVKGTVNLDGQPMASGEVVFYLPSQPEHRIPVTNGTYSGDAAVGSNKVGVFSYIEEAPTSGLSTDTVKKTNIVANNFSYQTTLTAEVTAAGPNEFKFDVTK